MNIFNILKQLTWYKGVLYLLIMSSWASFRLANITNDTLGPTDIFDVTEFGAVGDGKTDDTNAFLEAWIKVCASKTSTLLKVPHGKSFLLHQVTFHGPCKYISINIQILGNILAPMDISAWKGSEKDYWILFDNVTNLKINGSGRINGQGSSWWECKRNHECTEAPNAVGIIGCHNFTLYDVNLVNSPRMHLKLADTIGGTISGITLTSPEDSPNTDGIHVHNCHHINIQNSKIGTGDDCISIGTMAFNVNISGIVCGPGHGISIGSLGSPGESAAVERISISHCNLSDTTNGLRIKTWPGGSGYAKGITFEHITIKSSKNPIIVDQYYCNEGDKCPDKPSAVELSDITFGDVRGTSTVDTAINLNCSETVPCTGVHLRDVHLTSVDSSDHVVSSCFSVEGLLLTDVTPPVTCPDKKRVIF